MNAERESNSLTRVGTDFILEMGVEGSSEGNYSLTSVSSHSWQVRGTRLGGELPAANDRQEARACRKPSQLHDRRIAASFAGLLYDVNSGRWI